MDASKVQVVVAAAEQFKADYAAYIDGPRLSKGLALVFVGMVKIRDGAWVSYSQEDAQRFYRVDPETVQCECADNKVRAVMCKHLIGVMIAKSAREALRVSRANGKVAQNA